VNILLSNPPASFSIDRRRLVFPPCCLIQKVMLNMNRILSAVVFFALALFFSSAPARAGQYFQDFSAFPVGATNFGDGSTLSSTALGTVAAVGDPTYKELQLTPYFTGARSAFLLPDLDPGTPVNAFSAKWNGDIDGYGNGQVLYGFSFNFGQLGALDLVNEGYSQESGFGTGLSFDVQTQSLNNPGFYLRVNGANVASIAYDTLNQWGANNTTRHFFEVDWHHFNGLTVRMDGQTIFANVATPNFTPHAGDRFAWAARSDPISAEVRLDNIVVRTGGNLAPMTTGSPYYKSGEYAIGNQTADKAFDGDINTKWLTLANTGYVGATVSPAGTLAAYSLTSAEDVPGRDPQQWLLDGSTDGGASWTHITSTSGYFLNRNETRAWLATDPASFSAFRLNIEANNGDPYTQLAELRFYQFIPVPLVAKPDAATAPADQVNYTTANLNGRAAPNSSATTAWFQWGLTTNYGNVTANQNIGNADNVVPVSAAMTGLLPYTTYHCQLVASNAFGTSFGGDATFITVPLVWAPTTAPGKVWSSLACSTNGVKFAAAIGVSEASLSDGIYLSTDSGGTWTQSGAPSAFSAWYSIASSSDGTKLVAAGPYFIYVSTDSGANWTQTTASPGSTWNTVVSSADGVKLAATSSGFNQDVYLSANSGTTWTNRSPAANASWSSIASSSDGLKLYVAGYDTDIGSGVIYGSSNSGATWAKINSDHQWAFVTCTPDGVKLMATDGNGIYVSTNSGTTWTQTSAPQINWTAIACSADGVRLLAAGSSGVYISFDSGATWLQTSAPAGGSPVSSADGTRLAVLSNGQIWMNGVPPSVTTTPANLISYGHATLNGQITPNFVSATAWFQWGTTTNYGNSTAAQTVAYSASAIPLTASIASLSSGTTYHCRLIGTNSLGISYGADAAFTTLALSQTNTFNLLLPSDVIYASSPDSPGAQEADSATDGTAATEYLNSDITNSGFTVFPYHTNVVRAVSLISAGDSPERDPASFALYGSQDGINFTLVASNAVPAFAGRSAIQSFGFTNTNTYLAYQITFPTVQNPATASSMQIAEVELLPYGEITDSNTVVNITVPFPVNVARSGILDRSLGDVNKLEVNSFFFGGNIVVDITPATGTFIKGFEWIGASDDVSFPERTPSLITLSGYDGTNYTVLKTITPIPPTSNLQIHGYTLPNTNLYLAYRVAFGPPVSGWNLQVGEVRLFGEIVLPPPVLAAINVRGLLDYTEDDGPVAIDNTLTLSDPNGAHLTGVSVQITGNYHSDQDVLGFINTAQITGVFVTNTGTLTLTGTTTVANYQAALRTVTYQNTSQNPFGYITPLNSLYLDTARTVTWTVTDDQSASGSDTNLITVRSVNDAPVITSVDNFTFIHVVDGLNQPLNFGLSFADADAGSNPNIDFEITITTNSLGKTDTSPSLAGFPRDVPGADIAPNSVKFTTSIAQAIDYCANLYFQTKKAGFFTVTVTVNDNGFNGGAPPPSLATSYHRTTVKVIPISFLTTVSGGIDVTQPGDAVQATSANSPAGQGATNAIDNTAATKYVNLDKLNTGLTISTSGTNVVQGLTLISAEDAPERNPASYLLAGSLDGTSFTTISSNAVPAFITANSIQSFAFSNSASYPIYRLTFPTVADPAAANSMQIAEVELLAHPELTSPNDVISVTLPPGAVDVRGVARLIDRQLGPTNKFEVAPIAAGNYTVVDLAPAAGASVLTGFELIGGADDFTFPERRPSSVAIAGSADGTNFTTLSLAIVPAAPSANSQIQEFSILGNTLTFVHYRLTFGPPVSGDRLQVGELRLFGIINPPVAATMTVHRTAGLSAMIALSDLATNWSDPNGYAVRLTGIKLMTTNGVTLATNRTWILYTNGPNVNDQFSYAIADTAGATNIGYVNILIVPSVTGTNSFVSVAAGNPTALTAYGIPGYTYVTQRATNLATPVWVNIATNTAAANGMLNVTDHFSDLGGSQPPEAYYRLSWSP
jgi:hypothetical protein